jgi:branched-chain amino acid transport system permease protein
VKLFLQQLVNGLGIGAQYALWTVGYGLVYQVLGLMHFAHGDTLIFGAFVAFSLIAAGVPFWLAGLAAIAVGAVLAVCIEWAVYRPLVRRGEAFLAFVGALAAAFVVRNTIQVFWGNQTRVFPHDLLPRETFTMFDIRFSTLPLLNLACALVVVALFQAYLSRTRNGQAIIAVAQDRETAAMMGIPVGRIIALVYALSGAIGMIGILLYVANFSSLTLGLGFSITLKAFIAAIIGGIGSVRGAVIGGLLLGILEAMIGGYISTLMLDAILFTALGLFLVYRPTGIIGRKETVKL